MSKFSIILFTVLFYSVTSAYSNRPKIVDLQDEAVNKIDEAISYVKSRVQSDIDFGNFLSTTVSFGRDVWTRDQYVRQEVIEKIMSSANSEMAPDYLKLHDNLLNETRAIISTTEECMINVTSSSLYNDTFPEVFHTKYIPQLEKMKIDAKKCFERSSPDNPTSIAMNIICAQWVTAMADVKADRLVLELAMINNEIETISEKIKECKNTGFRTLEDKHRAFLKILEHFSETN